MWRSGAMQLLIYAEGWLMTAASEEVVRFEWRWMGAEMPRFPAEGERRDRLSSWAQTRGWINHACPKVWMYAHSRGISRTWAKGGGKKRRQGVPSWFIWQTSPRKSFTAKQQLQPFTYIQKFCSHFFCCCDHELILKWELLKWEQLHSCRWEVCKTAYWRRLKESISAVLIETWLDWCLMYRVNTCVHIDLWPPDGAVEPASFQTPQSAL